jgi:hypothetical protein
MSCHAMHPIQDIFLEVFHMYYNLICTPMWTKNFILVKSGCYNRQPDCSRSAFKRKQVPQAAVPRARVKARRVTTRRVQKEVGPSSLDEEASNINQVRNRSLNSSSLTT